MQLLEYINKADNKIALQVALYVLKQNRTLSHNEYVTINNAIYNRKIILGYE